MRAELTRLGAPDAQEKQSGLAVAVTAGLSRFVDPPYPERMAAWRPRTRIAPLLALAAVGLVQGAWAGDPSPGRGPVVSVAKGTLPSGGEFRLSAQRFGRHGLCLSLAVPDASSGSCDEDVPGERALSAEASIQCAGDTVVTCVIAPGSKRCGSSSPMVPLSAPRPTGRSRSCGYARATTLRPRRVRSLCRAFARWMREAIR